MTDCESGHDTDALRATWVDLDNERETRNPEVLEAWRECGLDLVSNSDPIELPWEEAENVCPDASFYAAAITPWWLAGPDGTLSFMDLVFRSSEYALARQQRDRVLRNYADGDQTTLLALTDGGEGSE